MTITITASANSTPPAGTQVATCTLNNNDHVQAMILLSPSGNALGLSTASPLYTSIGNTVTVTGSQVVTNQVSASISNNLTASAIQSGTWATQLTDGTDTAAIDSASRLTVQASAVVTNQVSASISNTVTVTGSQVVTNQISASISNNLTASAIQGTAAALAGAWPVRLTDTTDSVAVDSASRLTVAASAEITNQVSASISNNLTASAIQSGTWATQLTDGTDTAAIDSASRLTVQASAVVTNQVSASISNTVTVTGSQVVTNQISASISNAITQGAPGASPWLARLTDSTGNALGITGSPLVVTGGGGGIQYSEDAAHTTGDTGTLNLAVRRDANTSLVDTDGDYAPLQVTASGNLKVAIIEGAGSGGTALADKAAFTEGSTSLTPVGGVYNETISGSLAEDQSGAARMTGWRAWHVNLRDALGNQLGGGNASPLIVKISDGADTLDISSGSALSVAVTNQVSASISNTLTASAIQSGTWATQLTDGTDTAAIDSASRLTVQASAVVTNTVSASISNTVTVTGSQVVTNQISASISNTLTASAIQGTAAALAGAWPVRLTDTTDSVAVSTGSALHTNLRDASGNELGSGTASPLYTRVSDGTDTVAVDSASRLLASASAEITNQVSASISNNLTASAIQSGTWSNRLTDGTDTAEIDSASRLTVQASAVVTNTVSASISNTVTVTGSQVVTNQISASISNTLTASAIQGTAAALAGAWPVRLTDTTDSVAVSTGSALHTNLRDASGNELGSGAASPLYTRVSDGTDTAAVDSASRLLASASAEITNQVSASISNTLTASAVQSTGLGITQAWSVRLTDTTDSATITAGSALHTNLRDATGGQLGVSGSPLVVAVENGLIVVNGSPLTIQTASFNPGTSGCTTIITGCQNMQARLLALTFTVSACTQVGFVSGSATTASAQLRPAMWFGGPGGGMDVNRLPNGYYAQAGNGCAVILTVTNAASVVGDVNFVYVPV